MLFRFYLLTVLIFLSFTCFCQQKDSTSIIKISDFWQRNVTGHSSRLINKEKQDAWIKQKVVWMRDSLDVHALDVVEPNIIDIPDYQKVSYKIKAIKNINSIDNSPITITVHSSHEDPEIGDVCIGMTENKIFYINFGHVCGGMINFERMSLLEPADAFDFFNAYVSDTDDHKWVRYHF